MTEIEILKDKYKHIAPDVLVGYGLIEYAKKSGYVCPACMNGTGSDGTGMSAEMLRDGYKFYCHKCGEYFDVFDLIARRYGFSETVAFPEKMARAREIFGDEPETSAKPVHTKKRVSYQELITSCRENLQSFVNSQGGTWRGLTFKTLNKFWCGYIEHWEDDTPRVIIPTSLTHYLARFVGDTLPPKCKAKPHRGAKELFGRKFALDALTQKSDILIFVVEGEIDAMSLYQSGFAAVAISGSVISKEQIELFKSFPKTAKFILCLDADETGRAKAPEHKKTLEELGFCVSMQFLEKFGDFNDGLQKNPDELKAEIQKLYEAAEEDFKTGKPAGLVPTEYAGISEVTPDYTPEKPEGDTGGGEWDKFHKNLLGKTTKEIFPSCPVDLQVPEGYFFSARGIELVCKDRKGNLVAKNICLTPILPVKILEVADGSDSYVEVAVYNYKYEWRTKRVRRVDIANSQTIVELAKFGVAVNSGCGRNLSDFLTKMQFAKSNAENIPRATVYEQPGWIDGGKRFIYPPGAGTEIVMNAGFDYEKVFSEKGDKAQWLELFNEAFDESAGVRYALGLALAAPLVRICEAASVQGALIAKSGSGKSAVAKLAVSIFGDPESYKKSFDGTKNFLNDLAPKFNDLVCWIDEFQTADEVTRRTFDTSVMNFETGVSRGKLKRNSDVMKQYYFKGARLFTSEQNMLRDNFTQGTFKRLIELQATDLIGDALAQKIHKQLPKTYGHFGRGYVEYILEHKQDAIKLYAEMQELLRDTIKRPIIPGNLQNVALCYCGPQMFANFLGEQFTAQAQPLEYLLTDARDFWSKLLPNPDSSSNAVRALQFIGELRFTHEKAFGVFMTDGKYFKADTNDTLGIKFANGDVGFFPKALGNLLDKNGYPDTKSIMHELAQSGKILCNSKRPHQFSKGTPDGTKYLYYFPKSSFED